ncbi:MAG: NAD(P)/FAD-dependent oxidoreductase [Thermoanaerobaculia bacterium]
MTQTGNTPPIRIAGAGPSGLAAAITLARADRMVEVHEAKPDVGARFIGDLQIIENASAEETVPDFLRRIGIETNFYVRPSTEARFYDHRGRSRAIRSSVPYGYFIRRGPIEGSLDRGLLAQALALGVDVRFGSRLAPDEAAIVATGPATPDGLAREITFVSSEAERVEVYFDHRVSPGGYSYLFILDGVGTFGCAIVSDFRNIDGYFERALAAAEAIRPFDHGRELRTGYSYMNFHLKEHASKNGSRYVGEAGGFQDYLFGLGIRYAITTGHLAARSILENRSYDELWMAEIGARQKTGLVNRFLYESGGNAGLSLFIRQAGGAKDFRRYLAGWHRYSWWKRPLLPLVERLWKQKGRCQHKPGEHWCRARDTEMKTPPLGPAEERS